MVALGGCLGAMARLALPGWLMPYTLETFYLLRRGDYWIAGAYTVFSVVCGLAALILAYKSIAH